MTNIAKAINNYLKTKDADESAFEVIYNDMFPDDDFEGLVSRHETGNANEITYIDGSSEGRISIAYYCRFEDAKKCREILTKVIDILDDAEITDTDNLELSVSAATTPQFIATDDKGHSIYTCNVNVDYFKY